MLGAWAATVLATGWFLVVVMSGSAYLVTADQAEQSGLRAGEVERGGPLAEPLGGVGAQLCEQERDIRPLAPGFLGLRLLGLGFVEPGRGCPRRCHGTIIHS